MPIQISKNSHRGQMSRCCIDNSQPRRPESRIIYCAWRHNNMIKWPEQDITLRAQQELVTQSGGVNVITDLGFQIKINKYYSKNHNPTNCSSAHLFLHSLHDSLHDLSLWSLSPKNCHKHVKMTSLLPYKHIKRQKQTTRDFPIFYVLYFSHLSF